MADDLVVSGIKLDARDTLREIRRLDREMRQLEGQVDDVTRSTRRAERDMGGFARTVAGAAAAFGAFRAAERASRFIFRTNVQFQQLEARLVSVTGSVEEAEAAFEMIQDFAKTTPFQIQGLIEAFTQLNLRGVEPTTDMLRDLGNFAAAFGRDVTDLVNAISRAAQGGTERLREGFGIPIQKIGDQLRVEFRGTTRTVEAEVGSLIDLFRDLAQENFGDAMARQMDTLVGSLSNLEDVAEIAARKVGEEGLNRAIQDLVGTLEDAIQDNEEFARSLGQTMASGVRVADGALQLLVEHTEAIIRGMQVLTGLTVGRTFAAMANRMAQAAAAGRGLAGVLTVLGGPAGIGFGAAGALAALSMEAHGAESDTEELRKRIDELVGSLDDLTDAEIRSKMVDIRSELADTVAQMAELRPEALSPDDPLGEKVSGVLDRIQTMTGILGTTMVGPAGFLANFAPGATRTIGQMTELERKTEVLQQALRDLSNELNETSSSQDDAAQSAESQQEAIDNLLASLRQERDELRFTREELVARQLAEMGASDATIAQAQAILEKIDALEAEQEAQKAAREAERERIEAAKEHMAERREMVRQIHEQATRRVQEFTSNLQLAKIQEEIRRTEQAAQAMSDALVDPLVDFVTQTESALEAVERMVTGIIEQMARLALQETVGQFLSSALTSALGGGIPDAPGPVSVDPANPSAGLPGITPPAPIPDPGLPPAPGFAHGGSFEVPGGGNTDTKLVRFMATPGEQVTVDRKGGSRGSHETNVHSHVEVNVVANDTRGFDRLLEERQGLLVQLVRRGISEGM